MFFVIMSRQGISHDHLATWVTEVFKVYIIDVRPLIILSLGNILANERMLRFRKYEKCTGSQIDFRIFQILCHYQKELVN